MRHDVKGAKQRKSYQELKRSSVGDIVICSALPPPWRSGSPWCGKGCRRRSHPADNGKWKEQDPRWVHPL